MCISINFSDESLLDIKEIRDYYSNISLQLLQKFDEEIINSIDFLKLHPTHFQKRYRNIKIIFTKKFPFGIHYIFENDSVYVQRILHQKRFYK